MLKKWHAQVLIWIGVLGTAITLLNQLKTLSADFFKLANWARVLVDNFSQITHQCWSDLFHLFGLSISREVSSVLSFLAFYASLTVGSVMLSGGKIRRIQLHINENDVYTGSFVYSMYVLFFLFGNYFTEDMEKFEKMSNNTISIGSFIMSALIVFMFKWSENTGTTIILVIIAMINIFSSAAYVGVTTVSGVFFRCMALAIGVLLPIAIVPQDALFNRLKLLIGVVALILFLSEISKLAEQFWTPRGGSVIQAYFTSTAIHYEPAQPRP